MQVMTNTPAHANPDDVITAADTTPLVVDLDGTLLRSDLLVESGLQYLRGHPLRFWAPLLWLRHGRAALKERLAQATDVDVSRLPYSTEVIDMIRAARNEGRKVILATASDRRLASSVAGELRLFDDVIASDGRNNVSARYKRDLLVRRYGERGFDYIGNAHDDLPVLAAARFGFVVSPEPGVARRALAMGDHIRLVGDRGWNAGTWLEALRPHQWLKNLLILVPLLTSHLVTDPELLWRGLVAFVCFSLCASSVYLLNDLFDLPGDRQHPTKRNRPLASGRASVRVGLFLFPLLLLVAVAGALWLLPWQFGMALLIYYALTLAYSVDLKGRAVVDVIMLAALYTMRIIAGALAFELPLTAWILAFSMFMFLSLAMAKRHAELRAAQARGENDKTPGRGYYPEDLPMVAALGAASGYLSVLVLALYIQESATAALYSRPAVIWLACPLLLYWISRVWMLAHRGRLNEDPLLFAIRDRVSLWVGALFGLVFWIAM